ncbi:MAG: OmpA family protein [Myxococcales bacterium]|nr:OmpA family protein [Myxococcales bacterium]
MKNTLLFATVLAATSATAAGCGYSEDEWKAQLAKYGQLESRHASTLNDLANTKKKLADTESALAAEKQRVDQLEKDLAAAGFDLNRLNQTLAERGGELSKLNDILAERERALSEYKQRAAQLEAIKQRFELLRRKLNELTNMGLKVSIRNNRMVISLPGDVLFSSGMDMLKPEGENVLDKVAGIIKGDEALRARLYQVAGHTDNVPYGGGGFRDNWGLSLMRARTVLIYLIDPGRGGLPTNRWSAAGFGDTDPVAANDTKDGQQKNRRCEIIVVPSAEEMLDLQAIAKTAGT